VFSQPSASAGLFFRKHWRSPDLFHWPILVIAGPTIGDRRTFLFRQCRINGCGMPRNRSANRFYKAYYKAFLYKQRSVRAAARLLLKNLQTRGERPGGAGRSRTGSSWCIRHAKEKQFSAGGRFRVGVVIEGIPRPRANQCKALDLPANPYHTNSNL